MPLHAFLLRSISWLVLVTLLAAGFFPASAQAAPGEGTTQTAIQSADLDPATFAEWVNGREQAIKATKTPAKPAIWTRDASPESSGVTFGDTTQPGPRHLRVGFQTSVAVGSVLVRGGGRLSVLKNDAGYPGDLSGDRDWLPAERLVGDRVSRDEVDRDEIAVWVLPPGTKTRAIRFTHEAPATDAKYAGSLSGAVVLADRVANIAPQAIVSSRSRDEHAGLLTNAKAEQWNAWDNGKDGAPKSISAQQPEWVTLTWAKPVAVSSLTTLWTGFSAADVQVYVGPADRHPREATAADWKTISHADKLKAGYPHSFWPNQLPLDKPVTTRAVRLLITAPSQEKHSHLEKRIKEGRGVWLGELVALHPLGDAELNTAVLPKAESSSKPPIAVRFKLPEPGYVTLVIEDGEGKRVRNLVAETLFPAGDNVAWWDGTDDLGRDRDAAKHGLYHIPEQPVAPGNYRVRGLYRKQIELRYEFSIYNAGTPAWSTADTTGGWLTNHSPPQAALFVPAAKSPMNQPTVYLGSAVSEGGAGLAWVDMDGKKLGGRGWIGGNWTAAPHLARDEGANALPDIYAYVGSTWTASGNNKDRSQGELRLTGLTAKGDKVIIKHPFKAPEGTDDGDHHWVSQLGGIAVHDGLIVASLNKLNLLLFVDARGGKVIGETAMHKPKGLAFDAQGRLLVLCGTKLLRCDVNRAATTQLGAVQELVTKDLQSPQGITLDSTGRIYISDHGDSHQVKVFSPEGLLQLAIGKAGPPTVGKYDPLHMNQPHGLAIDERKQLWVTEHDFQPKRVSVWTLEGKLVRSFYGPGRYGGGGSLDPQDKTRFYYDGIEFRLDWKTGTNEPVAIFHRSDALDSQSRAGPPQTPIYFQGRQYMTNSYNSNPTGGHGFASIWLMRDSVAVPVASLGRADDWDLLRTDAFKAVWPADVDPTKKDRQKNAALFLWFDANGDAKVQPTEVTMRKGNAGGVTVGADLSFLVARVDEKAMRFAPARFSSAGVPAYDLATGETLATGAQSPASSGGNQAMVSADGWTVLTVAPQPYAREGFGGVKNGKPLWSYPSLWPGLHASHEAPIAEMPGQVIGSTRLLGDFITPRNSDSGPLWCINGNNGTVNVMTADGLYVARLFEDCRAGEPWSMPKAERNMLLNGTTLHDENFFPTVTQTSDGQVFLVDGARTSLVRVDGLESIRRLPQTELQVTPQDLQLAAAWRVKAEAERQAARGSGSLVVSLRKTPPVVDGSLTDWAGADWAPIDRRGVAAHFNSDSKPYDVSGAVAIAGDRLYAAYRTQDAELLKNSGETPNAPFKTGGCLDLMLGVDPKADPKRPKAAAGDQRLLITLVGGKTRALLYRAVVPGTREPVPFSSPWRTISIDRVEDVSDQVQLAMAVEKDEKGKVKSATYEISIPLDRLELKPADGQVIRGDIGVLRGNGFQTLHRVYWNNKATAITADVPSEAELTPALWGKFLIKNEN